MSITYEVYEITRNGFPNKKAYSYSRAGSKGVKASMKTALSQFYKWCKLPAGEERSKCNQHIFSIFLEECAEDSPECFNYELMATLNSVEEAKQLKDSLIAKELAKHNEKPHIELVETPSHKIDWNDVNGFIANELDKCVKELKKVEEERIQLQKQLGINLEKHSLWQNQIDKLKSLMALLPDC